MKLRPVPFFASVPGYAALAALAVAVFPVPATRATCRPLDYIYLREDRPLTAQPLSEDELRRVPVALRITETARLDTLALDTFRRLLIPTAAVSGFINNTPLVAILAPEVRDWADRRGLSSSRFLMPLSFATILGGTITVIGTSTNLVVSGLMEAHGLGPIGMFEISRVGLPVAAAGLLLVLILAPWVLPERRPARRDLQEDAREFAVQMVVVDGGPLGRKGQGAVDAACRETT